ncbi:hypothetical protein [Staphylococcus sp. 11261D007BR]
MNRIINIVLRFFIYRGLGKLMRSFSNRNSQKNTQSQNQNNQ